MEIPARTRSRLLEDSPSTIPALLLQCLSGISIPRRFNISEKFRYAASWARADSLSRSSALAKWVNMPSISIPGRRLMDNTMSAEASSGSMPMRLMPVSTARWSLARTPSRQASSERRSACRSVNTVGRI